MNSSIILDCQTQTASPCCEDCIAHDACTLRKKIARKTDVVAEVVELAVAVPVHAVETQRR